MENRSHAIIAVTFLIVFLVGAIVTWFWLSHQRPEPRLYKIVTGQSVSVASKSPVKFKGLVVGHVQQVHFDADKPAKVDILFTVHKNAMVTESTYAVTQLKGITGGEVLVLKLGDGSREPLATSRTNPARIPLRKGFLARIKSAAKKDLDKLNAILTNAKQLLNDKTTRHLKDTIQQLDKATQKIVKIENAVMPVVERLPQLADAMQKTLDKSNKLLQQATQLVQQAQQPIRQLQRETLPSINRLTESLLQTSKSIQALSDKLTVHPQSLIFGSPAPKAGPGEPGFSQRVNGDTQ